MAETFSPSKTISEAVFSKIKIIELYSKNVMLKMVVWPTVSIFHGTASRIGYLRQPVVEVTHRAGGAARIGHVAKRKPRNEVSVDQGLACRRASAGQYCRSKDRRGAFSR